MGPSDTGPWFHGVDVLDVVSAGKARLRSCGIHRKRGRRGMKALQSTCETLTRIARCCVFCVQTQEGNKLRLVCCSSVRVSCMATSEC